jgi:zeaxanthin glucosyltransferase
VSTVLFAVLSERGHIHPFLGTAEELATRGHRVLFDAPCDVRPAIAKGGFEQALIAGRPPPPLPAGARGAAFASLVADPSRLATWIAEMLIDTVPAEVERLGAVVAATKPSVIVADPMAYAAPIVASREGLPWVALSTSLNPVVPDAWESALIATTRALPRRALLSRYGLDRVAFRVSDCLSEHLTIALTTPALVGSPPSGVLLPGAALPLRSRAAEAPTPHRTSGHPLVFMSLGTQIYHQPRMFQVVAEALAGLQVDALFACGDPSQLGPLPANARAVAYAPQLEVLADAALMITHGGANSVTEALTLGVPLLVSPICNDQPHNARFVAESGAGLSCDLATASVAEVRTALQRLLEDPTPRARAQEIAASYAAAGGARTIADHIEGLLP